jgi:hypothetical protein
MNQTWSPRWVNIGLGAWLVLSSFLWEHSAAQFNNDWLVGLAAVFFAFVALRSDLIRYVNTVVAVWLFISAWVLPVVSQATFWNNLLVSVAMFAISCSPGGRGRRIQSVGGGPLAGLGQ